MNIDQVKLAIMAGDYSNSELNELADAIKYARAKLGKQVARSLTLGSTVQFRSTKSGQVYRGTLESIKIKNATVATAVGRYRVPMNMLEAV